MYICNNGSDSRRDLKGRDYGLPVFIKMKHASF